MTFKEIIKNLSDLPQEKQQGVFDLVKSRCGGDIRKITPGDLDAARAELTGESIQDASSTVSDSQTDTPISAVELNPLTDNITVNDLIPRIEAALQDFNALNGVEDWKKETITRWHGACMYIGRSLFKNTRILRDIDRRDPAGTGYTNFNAYDYDLISDLLDYYSILCSRVNKPVTLWGFAYFIGTDSYTVREMRDRLSPASKAAFEKVWELQERSLTDRAIQGGGVTLIATLNHVHGWDGSRQQVKEDKISQLSVDSLPRLGGGGA